MISIDSLTKQFIDEHESDDVRLLALRAKSFARIDFNFALKQIAGRQIAKQKIPSWYGHKNIIYPQHLSLEQSSSEKTALYKSELSADGETFIDLTGGLGVDFSFMSRRFKRAVYVEQQAELVELAKHNFDVLNLNNVVTVEGSAEDYLNITEASDNIIFIDPARRNPSGRKTVFIEDCTPNLIEIDELLDRKSKQTIIKLSPMLDITHALNVLKNISRVHIVSVNNETKELLLIKEKSVEETVITCVNLFNDNQKEAFTFTKSEEESAAAEFTHKLEKYLYEPNSSVMKAGAYKSIAVRFGLKKLHPNSHLYTSDNYIADFPGRRFLVCASFSSNKKDIKLYLKDINQANVTVRNYPISVDEIRKQTKLKDGGADYIFATTLADEKKVLILCKKFYYANNI